MPGVVLGPRSKAIRRRRLSRKAILRIERYWLASRARGSYAWSVRVIDVLSVLSTVAGLPALYKNGRVWVRQFVPQRLSPAIVLFCILCLLLLQGCAGLALKQSKSSVDGRQPAERPMTFRTLGSDRQFS